MTPRPKTILAFWFAALLGPLGAAAVLRTVTDSASPVLSTMVVAAGMPAPLVAALALERRSFRDLIRSATWPLQRPDTLVLLPAATLMVWFLASLALTWLLGDVATLEAFGRVSTDIDTVQANLASAVSSDAAASADLPPVPVLVLLGVGGGLLAGLTINGLFAFGEEYGWRGFLWEHLQPLGRFGTIGLVGVLWGLWHAPLILAIGLNYPDQRLAGVAVMIVFTVAASWPLDEMRRCTGSPVAPAILHGAINGTAGPLLLLVGGDRIWAAPTGLLGAAAFIPAGAAASRLGQRTRWRQTDRSEPRHPGPAGQGPSVNGA